MRASGALPAGGVSAQAARMILLAGLGGGASRDGLVAAFEG
ncbi:MAG TPA: hypothetical protein VGO80_12210 [Solirubrobacteraceae bacterium]|nr:hypothetical protein [Solirubrobacteraceae bacterium]